MVDIESVMHRIKNLQEFKIIAPVPEEFDFRGPVPFDMHIKDGIATVKVWALTLAEAQQRVNEYFNSEEL